MYVDSSSIEIDRQQDLPGRTQDKSRTWRMKKEKASERIGKYLQSELVQVASKTTSGSGMRV